MTGRTMTLAELAQVPPWSATKLSELDGKCRGAVLREWADHVRTEWGPDAAAPIRQATGLDPSALGDRPDRRAWFPIQWQLQITRAIVDTHLGGDLLALEPHLMRAGQRTRDKVVQWAARRVGPGYVLRQTDKIHRWLYQGGAAKGKVGWGRARIDYIGADYMEAPTWRVMQCFALRGMVALLGKRVDSLVAHDTGPQAFSVEVRWSKR